MTKKLLLSLALVLMTTASYALTGYGDNLPYPRYLQNMQYDKASKQLTFDDTFHQGVELDRLYEVYIFYNTNNSEFYKQEYNPAYYKDTVAYNYGKPVSIYSYLDGRIERVLAYKFSNRGGRVTIDNLADAIAKCYQQGYTYIRICVQGCYNDIQLHKWAPYEIPNGVQCPGLHNYVDVRLPLIDLSLSVPKAVNYGEQMVIQARIQAAAKLTFAIQESDHADYWNTIHSGTISAVDARAGKTVTYKRVFTGDGVPNARFYRVVATDVATGNIVRTPAYDNLIRFRYMQVHNGNVLYMEPGENILYPKPSDCVEYKTYSNIPVVFVEHDESYYRMMQPACNLWIESETKTYTVRFLNSDGTLLKTEQVECGSDATAPSTPSMNGLSFKKWSRDFTNVHSDLNVYASYTLQGGDYRFDVTQTKHTNTVNPINIKDFRRSKTRAMVGDSLTFTATMRMPQAATLYFQTAHYKNSEGEWQWEQPTDNSVASYTAGFAGAKATKTFDKTVPVAYTSNYYESPFVPGFAFRFYIVCNGERLYSDPFEYDVYYALTIKSAIEGDIYEHSLIAWNNSNDFNMAENDFVIPARYNDTVRICQMSGARGACLTFARLNQPSRNLDSGIDKEGYAYIICPGEKETVEVGVAQKLVVFDGVYGNGYPKAFDFTAEGFGKINNGYYAQIVNCGGKVLPEDPVMDGYVFKGWQAWNTDYADTAYLHVPAISDNVIGFTAVFDELPAAPQYTVNFYGPDGVQVGGPAKRLLSSASTLLDKQTIEEGLNATPPDVPAIAGYHFIGWDKEFTTITTNTDITALYGEDEKMWTVTYKNYDGTTLGTETVKDGQAAHGIVVTRENWTFVKWRDYVSGDDVDMEHITKDITVEAVFTEVLYTVTYRVEGEVTYSIQAVAGYDASAIYYPYGTPVKEMNDSIVFTFERWSSELGGTVTQDMTLDAVFSESPRYYDVRFQNWNHVEIETQQVAYGKSAAAPATEPVREGYTFAGWDRGFARIYSDLVVTATFQLIETEDGPTTGVENMKTDTDDSACRKILRDGILYIEQNGRLFNAQGVEIK